MWNPFGGRGGSGGAGGNPLAAGDVPSSGENGRRDGNRGNWNSGESARFERSPILARDAASSGCAPPLDGAVARHVDVGVG